MKTELNEAQKKIKKVFNRIDDIIHPTEYLHRSVFVKDAGVVRTGTINNYKYLLNYDIYRTCSSKQIINAKINGNKIEIQKEELIHKTLSGERYSYNIFVNDKLINYSSLTWENKQKLILLIQKIDIRFIAALTDFAEDLNERIQNKRKQLTTKKNAESENMNSIMEEL